MKILLAGGAGYIGSMLAPRLLERGYDVDVIDLLWFGNHLPAAVQPRTIDIMSLTEEDLTGYDQVVFLAGLSNDPMAEFSPARNFVENAACPTYLAYIAKRAGVNRFIYAGSCSVYGYTQNELFDEDSPTISNYPYGISKLQGEFGVLKLVGDGFSVIALRQGTVCGVSPRIRLDLVVNTMVKTAISEKKIHVNNPAIWRPILDIRDAAAAYVRAIEADAGVSGVFNVASGNYTVGEIADHVLEGIRDQLDFSPKVTIEHREDYRNYKVSTTRASEILGFHASHDLRDTVDQLVTSISSLEDLDEPNYYNIQTFKELTT